MPKGFIIIKTRRIPINDIAYYDVDKQCAPDSIIKLKSGNVMLTRKPLEEIDKLIDESYLSEEEIRIKDIKESAKKMRCSCPDRSLNLLKDVIDDKY